MIVDKSIESIIEELGGYIGLGEYIIENIGNWGEERKLSGELTGKVDSTFDQVSKKFLGHLYKLGVGSISWNDGKYTGYFVDVFEEALANSVGHGNNQDESVLTSIKLIECREGYIIRIRDSGTGFNPAEIERKRKDGELGSFKYMGEGFHLFMKNKNISFEENGTVINMVLYKS